MKVSDITYEVLSTVPDTLKAVVDNSLYRRVGEYDQKSPENPKNRKLS